jgi:outer membrane protein assembly factor BamC
MNFNFKTLTLVGVVSINLTACSYIKSLFPDKEKDYQYTAAIPPLIIPNDLKQSSSSGASMPKLPEETSQNDSAATDAKATGSESQADTQNTESAAPVVEAEEKYEKISVELVKFNDGENRLRLGLENPRAWRLVNKALSRKSIEVTNRNQAEGYFVVQYDPDEKQIEDGSLWDETVFLFSGFHGNEKEYYLKLEERDRKTDVIILDEEQQPLSDDDGGAGLKLLTLLQETINADLATKK